MEFQFIWSSINQLNFPKHIVNNNIRKTLQAHQDQSEPTFTEK